MAAPIGQEVSMKMHLCTPLRRIRSFAPALVFTLATSLSASTLYVAKDGVDDSICGTTRENACFTIQYAITNRSLAGDLILIGRGIYSERISVDQNLTLRGAGRDRTIIDGMKAGTVVSIPSGVTASLESLTIRDGFLSTSIAATVVGGINNGGTLSLVETRVTGNSSTATGTGFYIPMAGGIYNSGSLSILRSSVDSNNATGGCSTAGGMLNDGGIVTIDDSRIAANVVTSGAECIGPGSIPEPAGYFNLYGSAEVRTTTFWKNGISMTGSLTLDRSTISYSDSYGIYDAGTLTVVNSTIFGSSLSGIAVAEGELDGFLEMSNSTVSGNIGGGISLGVLFNSTIRNSILAANPGGDCLGEFVSGDYNLIQNLSNCSYIAGGHDLTGISADLRKLGDYGGPTETLDLKPDSPAIHGGNPAGCLDGAGNPISIDQRGFPRPSPPGSRCDIGAVEVQQHRQDCF